MKSKDVRTDREKAFGVESGSTIKMAQPQSQVMKVQLLHDDAVVPVKAHETDSGYDLYTTEAITIEPHSSGIAPTGIAIQLPMGYEMMIRPRSGISVKTPMRVIVGTIDAGYTGEIGIIVDNPTSARMTIAKGTKLAQGVIQAVPQLGIKVVGTLSDTDRGSGGYGSTGGFTDDK